MNVLSFKPVSQIDSLLNETTTFVFNIEPLHGDVLESIFLSEIPKDCQNWDRFSLSSSRMIDLRQPLSVSISDSPRSLTLNTFTANDLYSLGFGQFTNKKMMIVLKDDVLLPWSDAIVLSKNKESIVNNQVNLFDRNGVDIKLPVINLWKSKLRVFLNVPKLLSEHCDYHLITICKAICCPTADGLILNREYEMGFPFIEGKLIVDRNNINFMINEDLGKIF